MDKELYVIENQKLRVSVKRYGAELAGIYAPADSTEYLWQADENYWARHAPVLFPVVGRLKDKRYRYQGKEYALGQHGFARDRQFRLLAEQPGYLEFGLEADAQTRQTYPFEFDFRIGYRLNGAALAVEYTVINCGSGEMLFSVGAHPGFNIPLFEGEQLEDYVLRLSEKETANIHLLRGPHFSGEQAVFFDDSNEHELNRKMFENDALVFKWLKSETISLVNRYTGKGIAVDCADWPYLGIWMPPKGAPFICIEPWYGLADSLQHDCELEHKEGIIRLQPGERFFAKFSIRPL